MQVLRSVATSLRVVVLRVVVLLVVGLLVAGGVFLSSAPAEAATSTVCASGCDFPTIKAAVTAAGAGDTINVSAGTYDEFGITIDKPLTINGAGTGSTIVDGGGTSGGSVPGIFRILPGAAAKGSGVIALSHMTLQNPGKDTGSAQYYGVSIGVKQATTGITKIDLDHLDVKGPGDAARTGYGIYADGGLTDGADREAPDFALTNSKVMGQTNNGVGLDSWRAKATISGNNLSEGSTGSSSLLVMNEYTTSRMPDPVIVTDNTSAGRLISVRNDVGTTFGGYDDIRITDNMVAGLAASDFGIKVGSNATTVAAATRVGKAVIEGNTLRGDGISTGTSGILIAGIVEDGQANENDIVGVGTGINVDQDKAQNAVSVTARHNRLFADSTGLANATSATVDATENWWGCQDGPTSASPYCSPASNTSTGSVDTSTWVVTTTALDAATVDAGATTVVGGTLGNLNTGASVVLPSFFAGIASAFSADEGSVDPESGMLDAALSDSSTYTAPEGATTDTIQVTLDREEFNIAAEAAGGTAISSYGDAVVTGEPVPLTITVRKAVGPNGGEAGDGSTGPGDSGVEGNGDSGEGAVALPDSGGPATPLNLAVALMSIVMGALLVRANHSVKKVAQHRIP